MIKQKYCAIFMLQERGGKSGRRDRLWEEGLMMEDGQQHTAEKQVIKTLFIFNFLTSPVCSGTHL
jgi:hypothetical protein